MELIIFIVVVSLLFPSSGGGHFDGAGFVAGLLAGIIGVGILVAFWAYSMAGIIWLGERWGWNSSVTLLLGLFGPIAGPMLIASAVESAISYRREYREKNL